MARTLEAQARSDRADLRAAVVVSIVVAAVIVNQAYIALWGLFRTPGSVTTSIVVPAQTVPISLGSATEGLVTEAQVSVSGVAPVAVIFLVVGILITAFGLLAATILGALFCVRLLRGVLFIRSNTAILFAISMLLLGAPLLGSFFEHMGMNGVMARLGAEDVSQWAYTLQLMPILAAMAVGVLVIVFRRGERLQRDTEGLV